MIRKRSNPGGIACLSLCPTCLRGVLTWALSAAIIAGYGLAPSAIANEIVLKNGKIIQGDVRESGNRIIVRPWNSDATITLDRAQIEAIIPKEAPPRDETPVERSIMPEATETPEPAQHPDLANTRISGPPEKLMTGPTIPGITFAMDPVPDSQVVAALETVFPRILNFYVSELGLTFDDTDELELNIRIFDNLEEFGAFKNENSDLHYAVEGYYSVAEDTIVVWQNNFDQKLLATIYHEGTHAILRRSLDFVPMWIHEGLAEFVEGIRVHGQTTVILSPEHNDGWAKRFLYEGQMIPLSEFLKMTNPRWQEFDEQTRNLPRMMAWSLVAFLMESDEGKRALRRYLETLKRAPPTDALMLAYQEFGAAYPGGIDRMEREWRRWITGTRRAQKL